MIKKVITLVALGCMLSGCSTMQDASLSEKSYSYWITVTPAEEGHYDVGWRLLENEGEEGEDILSSPVITIAAGQEGLVQITGDQDFVKFRALVREGDSTIDVDTSVRVMSEGKVVLNHSETETMSKKDGGTVRFGFIKSSGTIPLTDIEGK